MKKILFIVIFVFLIMLIIPSLVTFIFYLTNNKNNYLESYVIGVVAAEMPVSFCDEALKAQAVAARTYSIYNGFSTVSDAEKNIWQAYISRADRKSRWGENFDEYEAKIESAVKHTKNEVLLNNGELINAVFHAISAGMTENSENTWSVPVSYLKSVNSHYDELAEGFVSEKTIELNEFLSLCETEKNMFVFQPREINITNRSEADYVLTLQAGNSVFTGSEIRNMLELRSSCFLISEENDKLTFTVSGYGHGVGMSQYGADEMARNGADYKEILSHYYSGTEIGLMK